MSILSKIFGKYADNVTSAVAKSGSNKADDFARIAQKSVSNYGDDIARAQAGNSVSVLGGLLPQKSTKVTQKIADKADNIFEELDKSDLFKKYGTEYDRNLYARSMRGEVLAPEEIAKSPFAAKLNEMGESAKSKYGYSQIISKEMSENPGAIPMETMDRMSNVANDVVARAKSDPNVAYDRKAVIFMGGPSSGKSSAGMKQFDASKGKGGNYFVLDSDDIKPLFDEFGVGEGAGITHEASAFTAESLVKPELMSEGMNLAIPVVGKTNKSLYRQINSLVDNGYDVSVVMVDLPVEKAASRNYTRMLETGRNVVDDYVRKVVGDRPGKVYEQMIKDIQSGKIKGVSGYARVSNDVPKGSKAIIKQYQQSGSIEPWIQWLKSA